MQYQDASNLLEPLGLELVHNKSLNLYMLIFDESYVYLKPEHLAQFDETGFKTFVARVLVQYSASEPHIVFH
jgi:hypothetical protein